MLTSAEVEKALTDEGTTLVVINSVCGCSAGTARPGVLMAVHNSAKKPDHLATSFAGFDVEFANPDAVILAIWIAFAYFLYRYYQYFSDEGIENLRKVFARALENKCESIIKNLVKEKFPTNNDAIRYSYSSLRSNGWL